MKYTEKDLYKGMKLRCTDDGEYDFWTKGAIYKLEESKYGDLVIKGEGVRSDRPSGDILRYLNGERLVKMEIVEEEKQMTKYAKITKYEGLDIDKENGLEIGKTYKIVSYDNPYNNDCRIYLNEDYQSYYITGDQYELVEKEEKPTFKTTIDLTYTVQAKADKLIAEAEHLLNKRDRLEQQAFNLTKKVRKLNKLIETIKEFE